MFTFKEEIFSIVVIGNTCPNADNQTEWILKAIEKRIDEMIEETHNNARRIHEDQPDYMYFRAKAIGMMQIKELLKQ